MAKTTEEKVDQALENWKSGKKTQPRLRKLLIETFSTNSKPGKTSKTDELLDEVRDMLGRAFGAHEEMDDGAHREGCWGCKLRARIEDVTG